MAAQLCKLLLARSLQKGKKSQLCKLLLAWILHKKIDHSYVNYYWHDLCIVENLIMILIIVMLLILIFIINNKKRTKNDHSKMVKKCPIIKKFLGVLGVLF